MSSQSKNNPSLTNSKLPTHIKLYPVFKNANNEFYKETLLYTETCTHLCMRIDTDLMEEDREKVVEFARRRGLKLKRAYTILIREGLKHV